MGQEIERIEFTDKDFVTFKEKLREETKILMDWFKNDSFEKTEGVCGGELEAWLVNKDYLPSPENQEFLDSLQDPMVVPEISKFNFELNTTPRAMSGRLLSDLQEELINRWTKCTLAAEKMDTKILAIGVLPTIRDYMLTLEHMSSMNRFRALNDQCLRLRKGKPFDIRISGKEQLELQREDLMMEAAATSLQIHLQVNTSNAARYYNASQILSAPMVALSANSPYLFGKDLWDETRIPVFEQAVNIASFRDLHGDTIGRVTFGTGYVRESVFEKFIENLDAFPILLPLTSNSDPKALEHLRLQNGTIWRWNRPIIGINKSGQPHLRLEHRVPSAGPSIPDVIANIAFYLGLVNHLAKQEIPPESQLCFEDAKTNFYSACKLGFAAEVKWLNGKKYPLQKLIFDELVPAVQESLIELGFNKPDVDYYIGEIIRSRVMYGRTGAAWQRSFIATHGADFQEMTHAYYENQQSYKPVHEWTVK
jgi:hypothetical protein